VDLMVIHGDLMGIKSTVNYAPNIWCWEMMLLYVDQWENL
jgi:hypothetical protein